MFKLRLTFLFLFTLLLQGGLIRSQGLQPVCQNYNTLDYIEDQEFHSAVADNHGTIYFATNFGVLVYKGERKSQAKGWDFLLLPDPEIIYSLYLDTLNNRLYIGGETQLGYFELKNYFTGKYVSLNAKRPEETKNTQVWHINKIKDKLVFHTVKGLLVLDNDKLKNLPPPAESIFHNVFELDGKLLINTITKGWYVYDGAMSPLKGSENLPQDKCYGVVKTVFNDLDLFYRNQGVVKIQIKNNSITSVKKNSTEEFNKFLAESQIYSVQLSNTHEKLVIATLARGAFIIENTTQFGVQNIIAETSASTQVKSALGLFQDKQENIWILGKTNLSILPSDLSMQYNELAGVTILDICAGHEEIFISTKKGLYTLPRFQPISELKKISNETYKKLVRIEDAIFCLRDFDIDKYVDQRLIESNSEFFYNDLCRVNEKLFVATESGILDQATGEFKIENANILQLIFHKDKYYMIDEEKGVIILDKTFKKSSSVSFNKEYKTLSLAKLFVYNNDIILRNSDNTFLLQNNNFVPLDPENVKKIWSHGILTMPDPNDPIHAETYTFEYDGQNNISLYLNIGKGPFLANAFKSSVEINDIVRVGTSYLVGTKSGLFISPLHLGKPTEKVNIFSLKSDSLEYDLHSDIFIPFDKSKDIELLFSLTGFYNKADNTAYKYRLIGDDSTWKDNYLTRLNFNNLDPGKYTFEVKGYYGNSLETGISTISFTVGKPWWQTWWAICLFVFAGLIFIYSIVQISIYRLKKSKIKLEKIVTERTLEIATQKNEIEHKNKEITDSINYAQRIQSALLTDESYLQETFPNAFILYKPKDIVSGDYYWFNNINGIECIVVADCTGHGVPGAFMSMLGVAKLNEIKAENIHRPDRMLNRLNRLIFETLGQGKPNTDSRDGMDIAIITIDKENNTLHYAGANRSLIIVNRETKTHEEIKATKLPVGGSQYGPDRIYEMYTLEIKKGFSYFLSTDGYADQFGGPNGKKFMTKKLNDLFIQISSASPSEQKQILTDNYLSWKQNVEQVDDVCIFGINF